VERDTPPVTFVTDLIGERIQLPDGPSGVVRAFGYQDRMPIFTVEADSGTLYTHRGSLAVKVLRTT